MGDVSISFAAPHPALSHLSISEIIEMHARFMKGEKVRDLLVEYRVETSCQQLQPLMPLRILNDKICPSCSAPMHQKWETRTSGMQIPFCKSCGHVQSSGCICPHCREWRICCANREWSSKQVPYLQLTLKDKILLAALLLTHVDDVAGVTETHEIGAFAPSIDSTQVFIEDMWNSGVIVLATAPYWVTTNLRTEWIYVTEEYGWSGNVSCETGDEALLPASKLLHQLLDDLCSGVEASDEATLVAMISELAEDHALAYIETQMDKQNLDLTSKSATRKVVQSLIGELPLADVCAIGWQAAKYCGNAYRDKIATTRRHAANMLPGIMAKVADARKLKQDPWKVQRGIKTVSRIERVLHDLLFEGHDTFFNLPLNRYCEEVVRPRLRQ